MRCEVSAAGGWMGDLMVLFKDNTGGCRAV
jgi:hypothetical protein